MAESMQRVDNFRGKGRHYDHPVTGHKMPSVTNVLDVISKPALIPWAAKVERELCVGTANRVYSSLGDEHVAPDEFAKRLDIALPRQKAHRTVSKGAINIGNEAHKLIEWRLRGELGLERGPEPEASEPALWAVAGFEDWRREVDLKPTHTEERLYSDDLDAAGSTDVLAAEMDTYILAPKKRRISICGDWKTSAKCYPEMDIQVATYRHMAIERGILPEDAWGVVLRLPKTLEDGGKFEARLVPPSRCKVLVEVFRAARRIWQWQSDDKETRR